MSHPASHWALYYAKCPSAGSRYILMILAEAHNGTDGRCFPSIETIAGLSGIPVRTVYSYLKQLEDAGLIRRVRIPHEKTGRQVGVEYILHLDFEEIRPEAPKGMREKHGVRGATIAAPRGATIAAQGVQPLQPSKENRERENREIEPIGAGQARLVVIDQEAEEAFELLWAEFPRSRNCSKLKAKTSYLRIAKKDRDAVLDGAMAYAADLEAKRKTRPDYPAQHLTTFLNGRVWENYQNEEF